MMGRSVVLYDRDVISVYWYLTRGMMRPGYDKLVFNGEPLRSESNMLYDVRLAGIEEVACI